jgi:hypothetical protein
VLAFGACEKEDNKPDALPSDGSFVELKFEGKTHRIDGIGLIHQEDSETTLNGVTYSLRQSFLSVSNGALNPLEPIGFSIMINDYDGTGEYRHEYIDDNPILSAVFAPGLKWLQFSSNTLGEYEILSLLTDDQNYVKITRDNNREIVGEFSVLAEISILGSSSICTGKFKIVKN